VKLLTALILILAVLILYMYREAKHVQLDKRTLYLNGWPKGFEGITCLFISDLHRQRIPKTILEALQQERIDLVLIGGDITEKGVPLERVRTNMRALSKLAPAYFVWGNHDYDGDYRALDVLLREEKITILDNRSVLFEADSDSLWLIGVDDYSTERDHLGFALSDITQPGFRLLLSHNPMIVEKLTESHQIGGILSGHTHGGQICLPIIGPLIKGKQSVISRFLAGEYQFFEGKTKLFVSRGAGTSKLPLRLGAPAELNLLTIKNEPHLSDYSGGKTSVGSTN